MTRDIVTISFKLTNERKQELIQLMNKDPKVSTLTQYIINALNYYESRDSRLFDKGNVDTIELEQLRVTVQDLSNKILIINELLNQILQLQQLNSSKDNKEISNYLDKITAALLHKNLEKAIEISLIPKLVSLLDFDHHADYLHQWIEFQQNAELLKMDRGKIIWNIKKVREFYE